MKSAIAAFVAAAGRHVERGSPGTLSLIITGDEEGPAVHGTQELLLWMALHGHEPDACIVGEPTSNQCLGDMIKIGRRGSLNAWITINGAQGHVAYPARADNPITPLIAILGALKARSLDHGTDWFQPSNLEITDINVGNTATNIIPAKASARLNIRFNDLQRGDELGGWIRDTVAAHAPGADVIVKISGEAFLTPPGPLSDMLDFAIQRVTGRTPELSTTGGTSDARFIRSVCPVVEFGLVGTTMHKVDEMVPVADIAALTEIYDLVLQQYFKDAT
jgi:succinyl-diaminopimelate desuccinylase